MSNWVKISKKEANWHPLNGNGGLVCFLQFQFVFATIILFIDEPPWEVSLQANATNAAIATYVFGTLYLLAKKSIWFVRLGIILHVTAGISSTWLAFTLPFYPEDSAGVTGGTMFWAAVWCVLWTSYLIWSRRINVTYRFRVKEEELPLVWGRKKIDRIYGAGYFEYTHVSP